VKENKIERKTGGKERERMKNKEKKMGEERRVRERKRERGG